MRGLFLKLGLHSPPVIGDQGTKCVGKGKGRPSSSSPCHLVLLSLVPAPGGVRGPPRARLHLYPPTPHRTQHPACPSLPAPSPPALEVQGPGPCGHRVSPFPGRGQRWPALPSAFPSVPGTCLPGERVLLVWSTRLSPCPGSKQRSHVSELILMPASTTGATSTIISAGHLPTLYDFHFDPEQKKWVPWNKLVPEYVHVRERKFNDILGEARAPVPWFKSVWFLFGPEVRRGPWPVWRAGREDLRRRSLARRVALSLPFRLLALSTFGHLWPSALPRRADPGRCAGRCPAPAPISGGSPRAERPRRWLSVGGNARGTSRVLH